MTETSVLELNHRQPVYRPGHIPLDHRPMLTYERSGTTYRPRGEFFFSMRDILGFHMTPTTEQAEGRCVWGLGLRSRALETCFAEKLVHQFVPLICWDFFATLGGGGG